MKTINNNIISKLCLLILITSTTFVNANESNASIPKQPRSVSFSHTIVIPIKLGESFEFITEELSNVYTTISPAHEYFTVRNGNRIVPGAIIDCAENTEGQFIVHEYVVSEYIENQFIGYKSEGSKTKVVLKNRTIEGENNTYVYWHFNEVSENETEIRISIVVQFKSGFEKLMVGLVGAMKPWKKHCIEEMEGLKEVMINNLKINKMTLLKTISKEEATGNVAAVYQMMEDRVKFIPNIVKLHSASPEFFEKFIPITAHYTDHPTLDPVLVSYVRLLISNIEGADYCVRLQSAVLNNYQVEKDDISNACADYHKINLDAKRRLLLCFVLDMMYDKLSDTKGRIDELTTAGWTEKDIYEASMLAAVQKGVTKVIKGFEVEFDF